MTASACPPPVQSSLCGPRPTSTTAHTVAAPAGVHPADACSRTGSSRVNVVSDPTAASTARASAAAADAAGDGGAATLVSVAADAAVLARYPRRARTWIPGRLTRTLIEWNLPSSFPPE